MKIKVSKVLAGTLKKAIMSRKDNYCISDIQVVTVSPNQFMDDFVYDCDKYGDVDFDDNGNDILKLIKVTYMDKCYANPEYFNTYELGKIAKKYSTNNKITFDAFVEGFLNEANI